MKPIQLKHLEVVLQREYDLAKKKQEVVDRIRSLSVIDGNAGYRQLDERRAEGALVSLMFNDKQYGLVNDGPAAELFTFVRGWVAAAPDRPLYFVAVKMKGQTWLPFFSKDVTQEVESQFVTGLVSSVQEA